MGTLAFGYVADRFGRRLILTWSLIWHMVCTIVMAFQSSGLGQDIWRFIAGIGIGVELVMIGTYISELILSDQRGRTTGFRRRGPADRAAS
jgi:putative MFS transporter